MMIEFFDQAWEVFSTDDVISQRMI